MFPLSDLTNSSAVFWEGGVSGGYQVLLLDEDQGWLLVGGKDHIYLLRPDSLDLPARTVRPENAELLFSLTLQKVKPVWRCEQILMQSVAAVLNICFHVFYLLGQIHWPAAREHVEHCRLAGKSLEVSVFKSESHKMWNNACFNVFTAFSSLWFIFTSSVPALFLADS